MVVRDTAWPVGTPCWVDMMTDDLAAARTFYADLLGWEFVDTGEDYGHYSVALVDGRTAAAIGPRPDGVDVPAAWATYLAVDDADAVAAAITAEGGRLVAAPGDVGEAGRMGIAVDPTGAVFGIWQAGRTTGVQITGVPGALAWNECLTGDYPEAKRFYGTVFGHAFDEPSHGDFRYATMRPAGEEAGAGLGALPTGSAVSPHWTTYFAVTDIGAALTRLVELGGTVHGDPVDSPGGCRVTVTDPAGGYVGLVER